MSERGTQSLYISDKVSGSSSIEIQLNSIAVRLVKIVPQQICATLSEDNFSPFPCTPSLLHSANTLHMEVSLLC